MDEIIISDIKGIKFKTGKKDSYALTFHNGKEFSVILTIEEIINLRTSIQDFLTKIGK